MQLWTSYFPFPASPQVITLGSGSDPGLLPDSRLLPGEKGGTTEGLCPLHPFPATSSLVGLPGGQERAWGGGGLSAVSAGKELGYSILSGSLGTYRRDLWTYWTWLPNKQKVGLRAMITQQEGA